MTEVVVSANAALGCAFSVARLPSSAATTNPTSVKTTKGRVFKVTCFNSAVAARWLKLYDKASAPVVGTDTPRIVIPLTMGATTNVALMDDIGLDFQNGIAYAITANVADADTTAIAAGDIMGLSLVYL